MMRSLLATAATSLGLAGALALLAQARRLHRLGSAREVSVAFLLLSAAGYLTWLTYGLVLGDLALIVVDAAGVIGATSTLTVTLRLRRIRGRPVAVGPPALPA